VLLLPNVTVLDDAEIGAFRDFAAAGGGLYASGRTSLFDPAGRQRADFGLAGVLGVSYLRQLPDVQTFLSPTPAGQPYFAGLPPGRPLTLPSRQQCTRAAGRAEVLATVTRAWTDPQGEQYASIIANPPGRPTGWPALVAGRLGRGRSVYSAGVLEAGQHRFHHAVLLGLVRSLARRDYCIAVQAPPSVEVMLYDQPGQSRMVAHLLEAGRAAPAEPVTLSVRLDGRAVRQVRTWPGGQPARWTAAAGRAEISGLRPGALQLAVIDYTGGRRGRG